MPGKRSRFTIKQDRMARHIAKGYGGGKRGLSIGYATINKQRAAAKRRAARSRKRR